MTITPRITVSAIEFVRSRDGSEEKLVETVSLETVKYLMNLGVTRRSESYWNPEDGRDYFDSDVTLTILRQEAEK